MNRKINKNYNFFRNIYREKNYSPTTDIINNEALVLMFNAFQYFLNLFSSIDIWKLTIDANK
jgi:hypothetical protein